MRVRTKHSLIAACVSALTIANVSAQTVPETLETRIGPLTFERGYPTEETAQKLFDELDYQRAVQAFLWAYPAVSFEALRIGTKRDLGAELNDLIIADKFADANGLWLTANDTTIYAQTNLDLGKSGPVVVEVPPGLIVGLVDDFWQRSLVDVGLPGPDGDKGGKFLLLPPGYTGEVPVEGYHVLQGTMNNYNLMVRGILTGGMENAPEAEATVRKLQVYPWNARDNRAPNKFISFSGKAVNTLPPQGIEYWALLSAFINNNPVQERDRFYMAMLKPLGIEKGKPFNPNARQRAILEDAARIGDAMGRAMLFDGDTRIDGANAFGGTHWNWVVLNHADQETEFYSQLDERLHYTYGAIYTSPNIGAKRAGPGSDYIQAFRDKDGNRFDGSKSYRLRVPPNVPAAAFWSLSLRHRHALHDPEPEQGCRPLVL
jgi:hypothetical protein